MLVDGHHDLVHRHLQPLGGGFDDAQVGLVRISQSRSDLSRPLAARVSSTTESSALTAYLNTSLPFMLMVPPPLAPSAGRNADRVPQQFLLPSACRWVLRMPVFFVGLEHDGAGAIAEQHAGGAIVPVDHAGQRFGADHQHVLAVAGADELVSHTQREYEAGTGCVDVEGGHPATPSLAWIRHAVDGKMRSGVVVPTTIMSSCEASMPAASSARRAAL